jgi:hypothetical protein
LKSQTAQSIPSVVNRLNSWQFRFIETLKANPQAKNVCLKVSRQCGKTTLGTWLCVDWMLNNPDEHIWYLLPYYKQCAEIFKDKFLPYLVKTGIPHVANRSDFSVRFGNGAFIQFHSAENYQGLRGATNTRQILDEFPFMRPEAHSEVLSPMMDVKGKQTFFIGTPRGKGHFYDYYQRGLDGVEGWLSFTGHYLDCSNPTQIATIEAKKLTMLPETFRQEYDVEFVDKSGQVFKDIQNLFTLSTFGEFTTTNYAGIDVGLEKDRTVITIINNRGEVCYFKRFELHEQNDFELMISIIENALSLHPNIFTFVEKNFNPAVVSVLRKKNKRVFEFNTTAESKKDMVTNLQYYISAGLVSSPNIPELAKELLSYEIGLSRVKQNFTFNAPPGGHDDCIISLSLACVLHRNKKGR